MNKHNNNIDNNNNNINNNRFSRSDTPFDDKYYMPIRWHRIYIYIEIETT